MFLNSRKFYVWLISLGVVLAIYLLYTRLSRTPPIDIDTGGKFTGTAVDSNVGQFGSEVGKIGDVGVGTIQKARYTHLNKEKQVDREFGFEKLLHKEGDEWEIEKPYMNIFRNNLKCYITADKGKVLVENVVGRPSPKDATLTGNVVIRIVPEKSESIKESTVYLDDIIFISEKSLFSTDGPVEFISKDAHMLGTGMQLVYNDELDRLEYLRIIHLKSLHLKTSETSMFSSDQTGIDSSAATANQPKEEQPAESVAQAPTDVPEKKMPAARRQGENYRCVFSRNVIIDCPEQLISADEVFINNIFFSKAPGKKSQNQAHLMEREAETIPQTANNEIPDSNQQEPGIDHQDTKSEQLAEIIVTCDSGIVIAPMDSPRARMSSAEIGNKAVSADSKGLFDDTSGRTTFVAQKIYYDASTEDIIAPGLSELTFYVNDIVGAEPNKAAVPVKITARKETKFLPALNQVIFEGDCLCTMDPNSQQKYTLSAPKLMINLSKDKNEQSSASAIGVEHLTADGGMVRLAKIKTAGEKLLGGIELKCAKFDYDTSQQAFLATGPGVIIVDNSEVSEPNETAGKFSLQRRCYAFLRDFDTLKYFLEANQIIADANPQETLCIDYFPIVDGQESRQLIANAGHIEANFTETADGQSELSTLIATGGIYYEDEDKQFVGSEMFYDANSAVITANGDESQPCLLNGVSVDGIEYNLKTDKTKFEIRGPGALQRKR